MKLLLVHLASWTILAPFLASMGGTSGSFINCGWVIPFILLSIYGWGTVILTFLLLALAGAYCNTTDSIVVRNYAGHTFIVMTGLSVMWILANNWYPVDWCK